MINVFKSTPVVKAIGARRETQRHLDRLTRQIAGRAGRQATTVKVRSRSKRRSNPRLSHLEFVDRLTFVRWSELDAVIRTLTRQEQVVDELEHRDRVLMRYRAE